jgi:hypothetical protein
MKPQYVLRYMHKKWSQTEWTNNKEIHPSFLLVNEKRLSISTEVRDQLQVNLWALPICGRAKIELYSKQYIILTKEIMYILWCWHLQLLGNMIKFIKFNDKKWVVLFYSLAEPHVSQFKKLRHASVKIVSSLQLWTTSAKSPTQHHTWYFYQISTRRWAWAKEPNWNKFKWNWV